MKKQPYLEPFRASKVTEEDLQNSDVKETQKKQETKFNRKHFCLDTLQ